MVRVSVPSSSSKANAGGGLGRVVSSLAFFLLGIVVGRISSLWDESSSEHLGSMTTRLADLQHKLVVSSSADGSPASSTATASLEEKHAMTWKIPEDIAKERHAECSTGQTSATGGFCLTKRKHVGGNQIYDRPLAEYLAENVFAGSSVVDLGAGLGHYGKIFREEGSKVKSWVGYDGAMNVQQATDGLVRFMDLTQPHAADERPCVGADWVMSLEVAEHIPKKYTDAYLRNVRCRARIGAVVSWGLPQQTGGLGHVNTRTEESAVAAVEKWGFKVDWELSRAARAAAKEKHFQRNVIVYRVVG